MKTKLSLAVLAIVVAAAAMPALGSDVSADLLWNRGQPSQADTSASPSAAPVYRPDSLIGSSHVAASPGITGSKAPEPAVCHCAMMDHARR